MNHKELSLLGLCYKAGKLVSGEQACEISIRNKEAKLIIVAEDASDNTKKKFQNSAKFYEIPIFIVFSKEQLGKILGKEERAVIVVNESGFSKKIQSILIQ